MLKVEVLFSLGSRYLQGLMFFLPSYEIRDVLCLVRGRVRSISIKTGGRFCSLSIIPSDSTFALSFVFCFRDGARTPSHRPGDSCEKIHIKVGDKTSKHNRNSHNTKIQ